MQAHRIVATTASARDARRLVEALSMHGVDGGRIHVEDPARPRDARGPAEDRSTDASVLRRLGARLVTGIGAGAVVGALVGAVAIGLFAGTVLGAVVGAGGGAVAGAGLGAALGLQSTPSMAPAWEDANAPGPGVRRVVVTDVAPTEAAALLALARRHARDATIVEPD